MPGFCTASTPAWRPLRHLCVSKRAHPEELFVELSRLAGALCTFSIDSHPTTLPLYDHLHLAECFEALDRHIRAHLELIVPSNCVEIPALRRGARTSTKAESSTSARSTVRAGFSESAARSGEADLIERTPRLVKICSRDFVPKLVERALPGLQAVAHPGASAVSLAEDRVSIFRH